MSERMTRRDVIKGLALAGAAAALPGNLDAQEVKEKPGPIIVALVGCAHVHTPGFLKMVKSRPERQGQGRL